VRSVYEGILKVLIELLSTVFKVFPNMCYDTLILSSIISFFFCEKGTYDEPPHVITIILLFYPPSYI